MTDRRLAALLFAGAALISAVTILQGIQPSDEGLMLQAAARIADGQVPYRDFWWFYPPGQPYVLAFLWKLFGPSLLTWRILRVLCDAAVATLAWALARRGGASQPMAIAVWLAAALAMAYPSGPHPFPPTLALCLGALLVMEKRPVLAGGLAGLAALWRIEFAAYLGVGVLLAYAMRPVRRRDQAEAAALFAGTAMAVAAGALRAGRDRRRVGDAFDLLIRYPVQDFARYQSLPFPVSYHGRSTRARSAASSATPPRACCSSTSAGADHRAGRRRCRARAPLHARALVAGGRRRLRDRDGALPRHPARTPSTPRP